MHKPIEDKKNKNSDEQKYILEGIQFNQFKESISDEDLEKINKFAVSPVESKDVTVYTALLIDDKITRNHTQYTKDFQNMLLSLPQGEGNFIGSPILFGDSQDHQHAANAQVGRIFEAWQVIDEEKHYGVMAKLYVLNQGNDDLINKINSGILKEMSIATKVQMPLCSICSQDIRQCDHIPGQNGCYVIMSGTGFVAESSFVAVPGSNAAKILTDDEMKKFLKIENLKEVLTPLIMESLNPITKESTTSREELLSKIKELSDNYIAMNILIKEMNDKFDAKEAEVISYKIDILSTLTDLKNDIDESKGFLIRNLSKYGVQIVEFRTDIVPELSQGLKGEDINMIFKLFYDNLEIMGVNLSNLENALKVTPPNTNLSYTGDLADIPKLARFLIKKNDDIKVRILKLQGKFDLQELERKDLINEAIKYGILCDKFNFNEKNLSERFFESFTTEEIVVLKDKFFTEGSKIFNPEVIVIEGEPKKEIKLKEEDKLSPREIAKKILNGGNTNG